MTKSNPRLAAIPDLGLTSDPNCEICNAKKNSQHTSTYERIRENGPTQFVKAPPKRWVAPKRVFGSDVHFELILNNEFKFTYAVIWESNPDVWEREYLDFWKSTTIQQKYANRAQLLDDKMRWTDTIRTSRDKRHFNMIRAVLKDIGINTRATTK
jgi:hypothetical protein